MQDMKVITLKIVRFNMEDSALHIALKSDRNMDVARKMMIDFIEKNKASISGASHFIYNNSEDEVMHTTLAKSREEIVDSFISEIDSVKTMKDLPKTAYLDDGIDVDTLECINSYLEVSVSDLFVLS